MESLKNKSKGVSESQPLTNTPARFMYNRCGAHTCKYLVNWRNCTKRELNLKWPNWGSFDILKLIFLHAQLEKASCALTGICCCQLALVLCDSVRHQRRQPTRLPCPWNSPGKNAGVGCHFLLQCMKVKSESEVAQLCPILSCPMDCSPPGSSIHGIFQARVLEWSAIVFSETS